MLPVRIFNRFPFGEIGRSTVLGPVRAAGSLLDEIDGGGGRMRLDVREEDSRYIIEADMPGFTRDDLDITIEDGLLTLAAEKSQETEDKGETYHVRERRFGKISRTVRLPEDVDNEAVHAALKDGVLTITLDKSESAKPHKIEVKAG